MNESLHLFVPIFIPSLEKQVLFNNSNKNNFTPSHSSWTTDKKNVFTGKENHLGIGSTQINSLPKGSKAAHQTEAMAAGANQANNIAFFDNVSFKKTLCRKCWSSMS